MIARYSSLLVVLYLITAAVGPVASAAGQQSQADAGDWVMPRTPDGRPDFQGTWTNVTITPFERPEDQDGPVLSWEEVQERQDREVARVVSRAQPSDPNRGAPRAGGSVGGYNNVYIDRGNNIAIVNGEYRSSLITVPADGRRPDLTAEGQQRMAERRALRGQFAQYDHPELRPLGERCIMSFGSSAGPPMIPNTFYNNNYIFVQTADHILIMSEMVHDARIIPLDKDPNPRDMEKWMGDSVGYWENDTLVVQTKNFHPQQSFRGSSDQMIVTERFELLSKDKIKYSFTIEDPLTFTEAWTGEVAMLRKPKDEIIYEYACHEGNYAFPGIMGGARRLEFEAAAVR